MIIIEFNGTGGNPLYRIAATAVAALVPESEAQKFSYIIQASLNVAANIVTNIHVNGYSELVDLAYFRHKDIVEYYNNNNFQTIVCGGATYGDSTIKRFQGLVWRASKIKLLNLAVLIEYNTSSDLVE